MTLASATIEALAGYLGAYLQTRELRSTKKDELARFLTELELDTKRPSLSFHRVLLGLPRQDTLSLSSDCPAPGSHSTCPSNRDNSMVVVANLEKDVPEDPLHQHRFVYCRVAFVLVQLPLLSPLLQAMHLKDLLHT